MATSSGCFRTDECRPRSALSVVATPSIGSPTTKTSATLDRWFRISPRRIQAWREVNEMPDRELMRDGRWLV
jgi:hypothetical protein